MLLRGQRCTGTGAAKVNHQEPGAVKAHVKSSTGCVLPLEGPCSGASAALPQQQQQQQQQGEGASPTHTPLSNTTTTSSGMPGATSDDELVSP